MAADAGVGCAHDRWAVPDPRLRCPWKDHQMPQATSDILRHRALCVHSDVASLLATATELDADTVHALRAASKEIRGLWQLLKPILDDFRVDQAIADLGETAASLSEARDRHVIHKVLTRLYQQERGKDTRKALKGALQRLQATGSETGMRAALSGHLRDSWAKDYHRWQTLVLDISAAELISAGYGSLYRKAHGLARKALANNDIQRWHRLRKWVKYLALTLPLAGDGAWLKNYCADLRRLAENIGRLHDFERLLIALTELDWTDQARDQQLHVCTLIEREMRAAIEDCAAVASAILGRKPRKFIRKLHAAACTQNL